MNRLKPIETAYRGYRFRSRLEARWAVAFDDYPFFRWEYEPQGFDLDGTPYLPDFRIWWDSDTYSWLEVKPDGYEPTSKEHEIYQAMANGTQGGLYLLRGINPGYRLYRPNDQAVIDRRESFVEPHSLHAGRSARFEHGENGAPLGGRR